MAYGTAVRSRREAVTYSRAAEEVLERHLRMNPAQRQGVHFCAGHLRRGRPGRASSHAQHAASASEGRLQPCTCWQEAARVEAALQCRRLSRCDLPQFLRALMSGGAHSERRDAVEVREIADAAHPAKAAADLEVAYGLFAKERLEAGEWCQRYSGECCTSREELRRLNEDLENARLHAYTFRCDEVNELWRLRGGEQLVMDATDPAGRNETAYINHGGAERSNVGILGALVDGRPCVFLYNLVAVEQGEELLLDYGGEYWSNLEQTKLLEAAARRRRNLALRQVKSEGLEELEIAETVARGPPASGEALYRQRLTEQPSEETCADVPAMRPSPRREEPGGDEIFCVASESRGGSGGEDEAEPVEAQWNFVFPDSDSDEDPARTSSPSQDSDVPRKAYACTAKRNQPVGRRYQEDLTDACSAGGGGVRWHEGDRRLRAKRCSVRPRKEKVPGGISKAHVGNRRCPAEGCAKYASGGTYCVAHRGGRRGQAEGCTKSGRRFDGLSEGEAKEVRAYGQAAPSAAAVLADAPQEKRKATSRYRGVSWRKSNRKWWAKIFAKGTTLNVGFFEDEEEAARAYDSEARRLRGSDAKTNFHEDGGNAAPSAAAVLADAPQEKGKACSSRYRGVCWHKSNRKWWAHIYAFGRKRSVGFFKDKEEAARAYDCEARRLRGSNAVTNFPE
ncbi:hypothetical protein CYMTET_17800, partial [Cymbomonas tetramitiformis]